MYYISMEFGKVDPAQLAHIHFKLPPDPERTQRVLAAAGQTDKPQVHVGCAKWGRKDWIGQIYPKGTKETDFLALYGRQFNCIELNAIYYKLPSHQQVRSWKSKVGKDFLFCPKFTDVITHGKRLRNAQHETDLLLDVLQEFGEQLGPMFLMPHPQMGPAYYEQIKAYLEALPHDLSVFLELRHPDWYTHPHRDRIFDRCEALNIGTVITDTSGRRDCAHMELTTPYAFVRFVGNGLHPTDYTRIDDWVNRIQSWLGSGLRGLYFFMHQHDELHSPRLIRYLIDELNSKCGLGIRPPVFIRQEASLFGQQA